VQDEVTRHIVEALKVALTAKEKAQLNDVGGTASVEAHDCFLKAREFMSGSVKTRAVYDKAREQLERAIQLDPGYGAAYSGLAVFYGFDYNNRWSDDTAAALQRAHEFAIKAVKLAPDDPFTQYVLSMTAGYSRDFALSKAAVDRALELNPNYSEALVSRGAYAIFSGESAEGIPSIELAIRLDPAASSQYLHFLGLAHLMLGNYETAIAHFRERIRLTPETDFSRALLASALGHLSRVDEARQTWRELVKVNPAYSFVAHMNRLPFVNPTDTDKIAAGLARAGLPD
jgi:adenylate cyclase